MRGRCLRGHGMAARWSARLQTGHGRGGRGRPARRRSCLHASSQARADFRLQPRPVATRSPLITERPRRWHLSRRRRTSYRVFVLLPMQPRRPTNPHDTRRPTVTRSGRPQPRPNSLGRLTPSDELLLKWLRDGATPGEIAKRLRLDAKTVQRLLRRITRHNDTP